MYKSLKNPEELKFPKPSLATRLARVTKSLVRQPTLLNKLNLQSIDNNPQKVKQVFEKIKAMVIEHQNDEPDFLLNTVNYKFSKRALDSLNTQLSEEEHDKYSIRKKIFEDNSGLIEQVQGLFAQVIAIKAVNSTTKNNNTTNSVRKNSIPQPSSTESHSLTTPESITGMLNDLEDEIVKSRNRPLNSNKNKKLPINRRFQESQYFSAVSESQNYGTNYKSNHAHKLNRSEQPSTSDFLYPSDEERSILSRH